jgi:hypothetical protein
VLRRIGAIAGSAALALSILVVVASPAPAASSTYTTCTSLKAATHATLSPGISNTTQDSWVRVDTGSGFTGCSGGTEPNIATANLTGAGKTFKPGDCNSLATGQQAGKILFLGTPSDPLSPSGFEGTHGFTAVWKDSGGATLGTSSGVIKAKSTGAATPTNVIVVLKITSGFMLSPDSTKPTKVKSTNVSFSPDSGQDCFNTPITGVTLTNSQPFIVSRKL